MRCSLLAGFTSRGCCGGVSDKPDQEADAECFEFSENDWDHSRRDGGDPLGDFKEFTEGGGHVGTSGRVARAWLELLREAGAREG